MVIVPLYIIQVTKLSLNGRPWAFDAHGLNTNPMLNDSLYPATNSPVHPAMAAIYALFLIMILLVSTRPQLAVEDLGAYELPASALPVELTTFTGNIINNNVLLKWSTATESNNVGLNIERKSNSTWEKIGFIAGKGNSNNLSDYQFTDKTPTGKTVDYRLKQLDNNGNLKIFR